MHPQRVLCTRPGVAVGEGRVGSRWGEGRPDMAAGEGARGGGSRWRGGGGGAHPAVRALIGRAPGRARAQGRPQRRSGQREAGPGRRLLT